MRWLMHAMYPQHPKIVKYKGSEKTRDFLYIILEWVLANLV